VLLVAALACADDPETTAPSLDLPHDAVAAATSFTHVSAGGSHTCALASDGRAYCWGDNLYGQLGDGTMDRERHVPTAVVGGLRFRGISAGTAHTCGITTDDRAYCWGYDYQGQLGIGGTAAPETCSNWPCSTRPLRVADTRQYRQISAGGSHTCAVTLGDKAFCWGWGRYGATGDGSTTEYRRTPVAVKGGLLFRQIAAGGSHSCGIATSALAYCWGMNGEAQLGDGTRTTRLKPTPVAGGRSFQQLAAGGSHTCAVTPGNAAYCWGWNYDGQLGTGQSYPESPRRFKPVAVIGGHRFERLRAGNSHTCGVTTAGQAWCWGNNSEGELGDGSITDRASPVLVAGNRSWIEAGGGVGGSHSCGRTPSGALFCWGRNWHGHLGDGTTTDSRVPVAVAPPS
jgi:alpha-tubulin suppressor-like RCC1 family protein